MDPVDYISYYNGSSVFYSELLNALHENLGKRSLGWLFIRLADIDNNTIQLYCPRAGYAFNNRDHFITNRDPQ